MLDISQPWWQFLLRAGHLLAGIVWIGLTYYFNLIQSEYFQEAVPDARVDIIRKLVPLSLSWSRMAALFTFLSGVLLMFGSGEASGGLSLDIAVGALLGTLMFLNVWFVIWPTHRIACGLAVGDAAVAGPRAQLASRTNVVFSLAMLLFMVSAAHLPGWRCAMPGRRRWRQSWSSLAWSRRTRSGVGYGRRCSRSADSRAARRDLRCCCGRSCAWPDSVLVRQQKKVCILARLDIIHRPTIDTRTALPAMPSPDDLHLTDLPSIVPERDEIAPYRRQPQAEVHEQRKQEPSAPAETVAGVPGVWRALTIAALLCAIAAVAGAAVLFNHTQALERTLAQSNLRIADLEGRLSSTDDSVNQSSAAMQVKLKEVAGEVDKLWASAWRKNGARIDELEAALKKAGATVDADHRQLGEIAAAQTKLQQRVASGEEIAAQLKTLKEQQGSLQSAIGRLNSTMNTLTGTQSAQESRLKESEQWVQSNVEFRRQVNQRLTRLENPPSALQP